MIQQVIKKEEKEKSLIKLCDILTAPSESEAIYYRHLSGEMDKIASFAQGVLPEEKYAQASHEPVLMLLGSYHPTSLSMSWATKWFLEKVMPLLQKQYPKLSCVMACADNQLLGESDAFSFIDEKSSSTYLSQSAVVLSIAPDHNLARFLEVFAYKIPVVATNFGLGSLPFEHGEHIMIADTPEKLAENIIKLIEDKPFAAYIAEKCYQKAHEYYGIERLKKEAEQIFARIG
jgi:glycosyltransferase involved in cell wall biosynthesis